MTNEDIEPSGVELPLDLRGLTSVEAAERLARVGPNALVQRKKWARLRQAAAILLDPMAIMLVAAAAVYLLLGETRDGVIMLVALVPVLGVDVVLDLRSHAALARLAEAVAPRARVVRDGRVVEVPTSAVVPGDLLVLREGDVLHADGLVRWAANLAIDESSLTGESEPQAKHPGEGEDARLWAGSTVLGGHGFGEVTVTGSGTRFGEIARLVAAADAGATPLQKKTARFVRTLGIVALGVALGVLLLQRARGLPWPAALLSGLSLAMASIPEEFPLVFTLFLSLGAWRLGRRGVLVRRLASVETLGSTTVICTDKTGTLTHGRFVLNRHVSLDSTDTPRLLELAVLACEPHPADAMDRAIVDYAEAHGVSAKTLHERFKLVRDHDFDPVGKHMSHVWQGPDGECIVAKGALEGVLVHCRISDDERRAAHAANARLAGEGMRVLALAGRDQDDVTRGDRASDERELRLYGLLGFHDPLRPGVPAAVAECQAAGIRIKMITGDHALTAHAIAHAAGILHGDDAVVTGAQLAATAKETRAEFIHHAAIFARIDPAQKHEIVEALRRRGEVVAMTGDGVNDAPALRRAHIGVAMGKRGTDVARAAADLVLLDDDFVSIVATIREGRHIFAKIQSAFLYLLAFHMPIVGLALLSPLLGLPLLLLPLHLVWLELIVHPVSAFVFEGEPAAPDLMARPPREPSAPLLPAGATRRAVAVGVTLTLAVLLVYRAELAGGEEHARAMALSTQIVGYQLVTLIERVALQPRGVPFWPRTARFWMVWALAGASLLLALYVPGLASLLAVAPLGVRDWLWALGGAILAVSWRLVADGHARLVAHAHA